LAVGDDPGKTLSGCDQNFVLIDTGLKKEMNDRYKRGKITFYLSIYKRLLDISSKNPMTSPFSRVKSPSSMVKSCEIPIFGWFWWVHHART
jgi:hypothetical protein